MTAQILVSELTNLIHESKRKSPELKQAAETSLSEIKGITVTSEKQLAADLSRRPQFVNPFLLACSSRNVKLATIGMGCMQRLSASQALSKTKLKDVLEAMTECTNLGQEIQLKILQTLPSLLQNYADQLSGQSLFTILQICSTLQTSKIPSVSGTSSATLQQLITSLYEKLVTEDEKDLEVPAVVDVQVGDETVRVRTVAGDAFKVFHDLCMLLEGSKPRYIRFAPTSDQLLLELIESIFTGHAEIINKHREQTHLVRAILIPYLIKVFSEKNSFSVTVRATRLLYLIVKHHLDFFPSECETILEWFNHSLDPDTTLAWKRVLCLEVFREIFTDPHLVIRIHSKFDDEKENKHIIPDCLASFVRLASEKPALIGLGQFSTVPIGNYFQRELATDNSEDISQLVGSAGVPTNAVPGISVQFSSVRTPCIEQLDKQEPPSVPETYPYSLVLTSLNNLAESLSKFIQQMTISGREKQKKAQRKSTEDAFTAEGDETRVKRPGRQRTGSYRKGTGTNPLSMEDHPAVKDIQTATSLIDQSWPAILASCSTFFNASLDAENYRALVRSFQKFTQVSGLLHMTVPRDAFLTSLGKLAMPQNPITAAISSAGSQPPPTPSFLGNAKGLLSVEGIVNQASSFLPDRRRQSIDSGEPSLNVRHLLCLRALLNIAIALGPTLDNAWRIVLETLQQADRLLASSGKSLRDLKAMATQSPNPAEGSATQQLGSEVAAVQAAASRLLESTTEFPNSAFTYVLRALCSLVDARNIKPPPPPVGAPARPGHKPRIASFSGLSVKTGVQDNDYVFTLLKMRELSQLNLERFVLGEDEESSGWTLLLGELISIATAQEVPGNSRLLAASIIRQVILDSISFPIGDDQDLGAAVQERALAPLKAICAVFNDQSMKENQVDDATIEAHDIILETLRSLLEQRGEELVRGWQAVFDVIFSAFVLGKPDLDEIPKHESELISVKLGRSAFNSLQLICSDFMTAKLNPSMGTLIEILYHFASQGQDLNISLTTTTFFWNVSDFLYASIDINALEKLATQKFDLSGSFVETIQTRSEIEFIAVTWLYLLRRLTDLISDHKHEVRNGAVHTALRILDNHGDDFSPNVWQLLMEAILLRMIDLDISTYQELCSDVDEFDQDQSDILKAKTGTSKILLQDSSKLIADYLESISKAPKFKQLWSHLMSSLTKYQSFQLHELTGAAFTALNVIMTKAGQSTYLDSSSVKTASEVWDENFPAAQSKLHIGSNLDAYEAYVASLKSIYKFRKDSITTEETEQIVANLEKCIRESESPSYSSDLDSLTDLHNQVISCTAELRTDLRGATTVILGMLARFIGLPLNDPDPARKGGLTYIALSKASMNLVQSLINDDAPWQELLNSDALQLVLKNLKESIRLKYNRPKQGRNPPLWKKATGTAITILENILPRIFDYKLPQASLRGYWDSTVGIGHNIIHADVKSLLADDLQVSISALNEDEEFDITAIVKLNTLMVPALGDATIPDPTRRSFARSLFTASLVHHRSQISDTEGGDLPPRLDSEPLANLYAIRPGRTFDTPPVAREKMAYTCFRALLDLLRSRGIQTSGSTAEADLTEPAEKYVRLAQAAAPYVILRAALPLKTYVADQPLRGKMPMPATQVYEMISILSELGELRCERKAIPATEGVESSEGGQLVRLYPLVVKAAGVRNGPIEVRKVVERWMVRLCEQLGVEE